jgi:hypothetical protein
MLTIIQMMTVAPKSVKFKKRAALPEKAAFPKSTIKEATAVEKIEEGKRSATRHEHIQKNEPIKSTTALTSNPVSNKHAQIFSYPVYSFLPIVIPLSVVKIFPRSKMISAQL